MDVTQFTKSTNGTIITVGKPYLFKSDIYGDTAVHVTAIYQGVIHFTIDGGESSRQARDFPELSDGKYFAISERIERRTRSITAKNLQPARTSDRSAKARAEDKAAWDTQLGRSEVKNTIREVPGIGKVAVVTTEPLKQLPSAEQVRNLSAQEAADLAASMNAVPLTADQLSTMSAMEVGRYARKHYSTIGRLTKKADIIAAIKAIESKEETF